MLRLLQGALVAILTRACLCAPLPGNGDVCGLPSNMTEGVAGSCNFNSDMCGYTFPRVLWYLHTESFGGLIYGKVTGDESGQSQTFALFESNDPKANDTASQKSSIESPEITGDRVCVKFWYLMPNQNSKLQVYMMPVDAVTSGDAMTLLFEHEYQPTSSWLQIQLLVNSTAPFKIQFVSEKENNYGYVGIDYVQVLKEKIFTTTTLSTTTTTPTTTTSTTSTPTTITTPTTTTSTTTTPTTTTSTTTTPSTTTPTTTTSTTTLTTTTPTTTTSTTTPTTTTPSTTTPTTTTSTTTPTTTTLTTTTPTTTTSTTTTPTTTTSTTITSSTTTPTTTTSTTTPTTTTSTTTHTMTKSMNTPTTTTLTTTTPTTTTYTTTTPTTTTSTTTTPSTTTPTTTTSTTTPTTTTYTTTHTMTTYMPTPTATTTPTTTIPTTTTPTTTTPTTTTPTTTTPTTTTTIPTTSCKCNCPTMAVICSQDITPSTVKPAATICDMADTDLWSVPDYGCTFDADVCMYELPVYPHLWERTSYRYGDVNVGQIHADHSTVGDGGYMVFNTYNNHVQNNTSHVLASPALAAFTEYCLSFWYNMPNNHSNLDVNVIEASPVSASTATSIWRAPQARTDGWTNAKIALLQNTSFTVQFLASKEGQLSFLAIDDIKISVVRTDTTSAMTSPITTVTTDAPTTSPETTTSLSATASPLDTTSPVTAPMATSPDNATVAPPMTTTAHFQVASNRIKDFVASLEDVPLTGSTDDGCQCTCPTSKVVDCATTEPPTTHYASCGDLTGATLVRQLTCNFDHATPCRYDIPVYPHLWELVRYRLGNSSKGVVDGDSSSIGGDGLYAAFVTDNHHVPVGEKADLTSPFYAGQGEMCLSFTYNMPTESSMLAVYTMTTGHRQLQWQVAKQLTTGWQQASIPLNFNETFQLIFSSEKHSVDGYLGLDDIRVYSV